MELLAGSRIALTPRPLRRREAALEVAMLGHCPGRVRLDRLLALSGALEEMRSAGFGVAVDALSSGTLTQLYHLPIPLYSSAEFHDIFPDAATNKTAYVSLLAGAQAWLAQAVDDYFANGGEKLWIVQVPEAGRQAAFLPAENTVIHDTETLQGLATVLVIPEVAVVAMPDLERLQIPPRMSDIPRVRLENPDPRFMPCSQDLDDDHRERRHSDELPSMPQPRPSAELLQGILRAIVRYRPDLQCLFSLPLSYSGELGSPVVDPTAIATVESISEGGSGHTLRHLQLLYPYLRGPRFSLRSPVGLVAGQQAAVAWEKGPWHSMAARTMITDAVPYPATSLAQTLHLREQPGIGILHKRSGRVSLDDERLVVPALPAADYSGSNNMRRYDGYRAAEVMRFLGYLRRQLQALGEVLVFNIDFRDPRPRLMLQDFFRRLHTQGALRGTLPEEAYVITESQPQPGAILFEIMIAPTFPIDRLYLTFANQNGAWQAEVTNG